MFSLSLLSRLKFNLKLFSAVTISAWLCFIVGLGKTKKTARAASIKIPTKINLGFASFLKAFSWGTGTRPAVESTGWSSL